MTGRHPIDKTVVYEIRIAGIVDPQGANYWFEGLTVTALMSDTLAQTPDKTGYYRIRPPLKPITLAELAAMDAPEQAAGE